jgi:hypothetical protein
MAVSYTTLKARKDAAAAAVTVTEAPGADIEITFDEQRQVAAQVERMEMAALAKLADEEKAAHAERGEVYIAKVIDPHERKLATVVGSWEPITPSLCIEAASHGYGGGCGWDAAKEVGFKSGWDSIPEDMRFGTQSMREFVLEKLAQHKSIKHVTSGPTHIRTPERAKAERAKRPLPEGFVENPRL